MSSGLAWLPVRSRPSSSLDSSSLPVTDRRQGSNFMSSSPVVHWQPGVWGVGALLLLRPSSHAPLALLPTTQADIHWTSPHSRRYFPLPCCFLSLLLSHLNQRLGSLAQLKQVRVESIALFNPGPPLPDTRTTSLSLPAPLPGTSCSAALLNPCGESRQIPQTRCTYKRPTHPIPPIGQSQALVSSVHPIQPSVHRTQLQNRRRTHTLGLLRSYLLLPALLLFLLLHPAVAPFLPPTKKPPATIRSRDTRHRQLPLSLTATYFHLHSAPYPSSFSSSYQIRSFSFNR